MTVIDEDGVHELAQADKDAVSRALVERIAAGLAARGGATEAGEATGSTGD